MSDLWRNLALSGLLIMLSAVPALAQAEKGDKEVLLNGNVTTSFGGDSRPSATSREAAIAMSSRTTTPSS